MNLISVFIITKNEEKRIERAINSVKNIADEIIIIDSGSTDKTVDIAKNLGAKVIFNEWTGYVDQKIFGERLCKNDWILNIDADESLTIELQDEISKIWEKGEQDQYKAYKFDVIIMHRSDELKHRLWAPRNKVIRLYNKLYASFANHDGSTTHDSVFLNKNLSCNDNVKDLKYGALHYSGTSIDQLVSKANFYSREQAKDIISSGRDISNLRVFLEFFLCLFKAFIIRRYFVFGFDGFIDSMVFAFARFLRLAKAREMNRVNHNNK